MPFGEGMEYFRFHRFHQGTSLKTLTPKQMLQRLPMSLAQVKAGSTLDNLLNEIRHIDTKR